MGKYISLVKIYPSRSQIKVLDRNHSSAGSIRDPKHCVQGKQGRCTVCADCTVAYISADSPDIADLRTSNLIHSLTQDRYQLLNHRVFGNMGKGGSCSDENVTGIHQPDPPDFLNIPDTYQRCSCHFPFTYFDQNITSAGDYPCIRVLLQKQNCLFYSFCVIIIFDIVHSSCPLSQISPAFVKPSISLCGVRGISANPIPVACKTALRIAGAPGIAGGSPRALFP